MASPFANSLVATEKLYEQLKCESCKKLPDYPYYTGVCDHLLCKGCVFKSNNCPVCGEFYTENNILMVDAVKDMISSVNNLLKLLKSGCFDDDDDEIENDEVEDFDNVREDSNIAHVNIKNDENDYERESKKTRTDFDKDVVIINEGPILKNSKDPDSIDKEQDLENVNNLSSDNFVNANLNESNDGDFQSILEANILNKAKSIPERPKSLELKTTNQTATVSEHIYESNDIEIVSVKNDEVEDVIMDDEVTKEADVTVEMDDRVNDHFNNSPVKFEHDENKLGDYQNTEVESKNKRVAEQDALDLFMSFYDNDQPTNKISNHDETCNKVHGLRLEHEKLGDKNNNLDSSNKSVDCVIDKESIKNEPEPEKVINNIVIEVDNEDKLERNKTETFLKSEEVMDKVTEINLIEKQPLIEFKNEIVEIKETKIQPIKEPEEKRKEENNGNQSTSFKNESINISNDENLQVSLNDEKDTSWKKPTRRQNKSVIFKPIANRKALKEEVNNTSVLDISELKLDEDKPTQKPKGRGRKVKTEKIENEILPTQTQGDAKNPKRIKKNDKGETQLHIAAMNGEYELCKSLLEQGMDPNIRDYAGWTPLHEACGNGHLDIVTLLVDNNADINIKGFKDSTPLHEAILNNYMDCAKYLLNKNPDINIRNSHGFLAKDFLKNNKNDNELKKLFEKIESNNKALGVATNIVISTQAANTTGKSRGKRNSNAKPKPVVVYSTGMNEDEKIKLAETAKKLNFKFVREMSANVTHVVFKDAQNNKTCQRTINYMKAVLMGLWIVSIKWVEDSLANGSLLDENEYEAKGSHKIADSNAPFKGRMNASYENPNLFEDCHFYFYGDFKVFEKNDLINLVKLGGGTIVRREPKLDRLDELMTKTPFHADKNFKCTHFIIYDTTRPREIIRNTYLNTMNVNWIFNCIDYFMIKMDEITK